jgi:hypothetical protein
MSLLLAQPLGAPLTAPDYDDERYPAPDAAAMALIQLIDDEDGSTAIEMLQLAGYDSRYGEALLDREPSWAPDPQVVRTC